MCDVALAGKSLQTAGTAVAYSKRERGRTGMAQHGAKFKTPAAHRCEVDKHHKVKRETKDNTESNAIVCKHQGNAGVMPLHATRHAASQVIP